MFWSFQILVILVILVIQLLIHRSFSVGGVIYNFSHL